MTQYFLDFEFNLDKMKYNIDDSEHILQLNYAYIITCMETYLYTAMWETLNQHPENYNNLGKGINNSAKLSTIFNKGIPKFLQQELNNLQYHNLSQVKIHYKNAFDINFKIDIIPYILKAIGIRHDIVHRCGFSKKNIQINIVFEDINKLRENVVNFISDIDLQLSKNFQEL
jgi:hypothetical protein